MNMSLHILYCVSLLPVEWEIKLYHAKRMVMTNSEIRATRKIRTKGAVEMAQRLRGLAALAEVLRSFPATTSWLTAICKWDLVPPSGQQAYRQNTVYISSRKLGLQSEFLNKQDCYTDKSCLQKTRAAGWLRAQGHWAAPPKDLVSIPSTQKAVHNCL